MSKHEKIPCERCGTFIECKSNSFTKCACASVFLTHNEIEWINDQFEGCLCNNCLEEIKKEYQKSCAY